VARRRRLRTRSESGESLIEVLVSTIILGLGVTSLLGGLAVAVFGSSLHRDQADASTLMTAVAEHVKEVPYAECATRVQYLDTFTSYRDYTITTTPTGLSVTTPSGTLMGTVTFAIKDWYGDADFVDRLADGSCALYHDEGIRSQLVTITAYSADGKVSQRIPIVKRFRDCQPTTPVGTPGCDVA
jgi:type II secretory pathway pseudopilin PulG